MSKNSPDIDRLKIVLDAYGAATKRWPASERVYLQETLENSDIARQLYLEAQTLDQLISNSSVNPTAPASLMGAVLQETKAPEQSGYFSISGLFQQLLKPISGLAFAACLGIIAGLYSPQLTSFDYEPDLDEISVSNTLFSWEDDNETL